VQQNNLYSKLLADIFSYGFLDSLTRLIGFLMLPVLTRIFSMQEYGVIDLIAAFSAFLLIFSTLGIQSSLARYYHSSGDEHKNQQLFSSLLIFNLLSSTLVLTLVFLFSKPISLAIANGEDYSVFIRLGALAAFFNSLSNVPLMLLRRRRKIKQFGMVKITISILYAGLTLLLILVFDFGLKGVFLAQALAFFMGFIISLLVTYPFFNQQIDTSAIKKSLKFALPMFPSYFVTWANSQFNRFIIISLLNASLLGLFSAAFRISSIIQILTQVFRKAWLPFSMEIIHEKSRGTIINGLMKYYLTFFLLLSLCFSMIAPEIVDLMLPHKYQSAYLFVPWLTGAFIIHNSGNILNMGSIIKEKTAINSIAAWSGFALNVLLCLLIIKPFGIIGAAIGLFAANLLSNIILLWKTERMSEISFSKIYLLMLLMLYIITSIGLILLTKHITSIYFSLLLRFMVVFGIALLIDRILWKNVIRHAFFKAFRELKPVIFHGKKNSAEKNASVE
jgi:O-antigen/teichoic acid export membrane protein